MPRRDDLESILLIGSGPIVIGQACEFDYSGTQACRVLRAEGYRVILANSNPATIMTDPDFADATYVEPLHLDVLTRIIERERPDALLPTLGGQTALNLAMELANSGVLDAHGVEMIGAKREAISTAEDREAFKSAMQEVGLAVPSSGVAHSLEEALTVVERIMSARDRAPRLHPGRQGHRNRRRPWTTSGPSPRSGLAASPISEILIERSIRWLEGVRAGGHARPGRQLRGHLLDREPRPDGGAHRRLDHRRPGPDAVRRRVPGHARRGVRLHPPGRGRDRRLQHPVRASIPTAATWWSSR